MTFKDDIDEIINNAHFWNWLPDWDILNDIYLRYPDSYSILLPFAYTYLEELVRSTTSQYGIEIVDEKGKPKHRAVGIKLLQLAIEQNTNTEYIALLEDIKKYYLVSDPTNGGSNRNNVMHGYLHPRFWTQKDFESVIHLIAMLTRFTPFKRD